MHNQLFSRVEFRTICHTFDRFVDGEENKFGEIFVKADNNWWVVFKCIDQRVLALFVPQSAQSTIADVNTVVENIIHKNFHNIFLP